VSEEITAQDQSHLARALDLAARIAEKLGLIAGAEGEAATAAEAKE